jgi:hypothetical protein
MKNKALDIIMKILGLALSIFVFVSLLPMCGTVPDKWFTICLWCTISSGFAAVFFVCWIVATIAKRYF